jgi:glycosyltransferase involved in cell wall biosynthesis
MNDASEAAAAATWQCYDSVYFFMWPGWREQLESNRWHWGKRWAQRLPVVFIQPELGEAVRWCAEPDKRLANVTVLSIECCAADQELLLSTGLRQAGQLASYMNAQAHRRPLFWMYNPLLTPAYLMLPGCARVFHATENYFQFDGLNDYTLDLNRCAIEASDLVICCSSGVVKGVVANTEAGDPLLIPNGCDYRKYRSPTEPVGDWPGQIGAWRRDHRKLAVFAGNINLRLDYELVVELAQRQPDTGFIYAGPVEVPHLSPAQRQAWRRLLDLPNVRALGRIPAEDLPALYWNCDVGIIPYRTDLKMVVENGFPLKAIEMAAAGLPVVATLMKPLCEVPEAVTVTASAEAFCAAVATHSRGTRLREQIAAADRVCRAHDYDLLFDRMGAALLARVGDQRSAPRDLARFADRLGTGAYTAMLARLDRPAPAVAPTPPRAAQRFAGRAAPRHVAAVLLGSLPAPVRRLIPARMRRLVRQWIA